MSRRAVAYRHRFATASAACSSVSSAIFCASIMSPTGRHPSGPKHQMAICTRSGRVRKCSFEDRGGCDSASRCGSPSHRSAPCSRIGQVGPTTATVLAGRALFARPPRPGKADRRDTAPMHGQAPVSGRTELKLTAKSKSAPDTGSILLQNLSVNQPSAEERTKSLRRRNRNFG